MPCRRAADLGLTGESSPSAATSLRRKRRMISGVNGTLIKVTERFEPFDLGPAKSNLLSPLAPAVRQPGSPLGQTLLQNFHLAGPLSRHIPCFFRIGSQVIELQRWRAHVLDELPISRPHPIAKPTILRKNSSLIRMTELSE